MMPLKQTQSGFSLLEVLIALVVVTIGLLGFAAMQGTAVKNSQSAHHTTLATTLAYDAFDRLRSGESIAEVTTALEVELVQNRFPGDLTVAIAENDDSTTITLNWADARVGIEGNDAVSSNEISVTSQI